MTHYFQHLSPFPETEIDHTRELIWHNIFVMTIYFLDNFHQVAIMNCFAEVLLDCTYNKNSYCSTDFR